MAETIATVFVEGDTEVDFYKKLIAYLRDKNGGRLHCKVDVRNVKGVGRYQNKVCRIFENSVKKQYPGHDYKVVLCYDSDVFEFSRKPPVDWDEVTRALREKGADDVRLVKAVTSIEDWFLYDVEGLRKFLKLPKKFKMTGYKGQKGLAQLFLKAKKTYIKGVRCNGLIEALDLDVIIPNIESEIANISELLR
ncbi:MAG: hypothetical protein IKI23_08850 [Lachnospiraceae bacterium]|jgi:hypothetical protein|nr:hypothetical protein [Lachnospiraceae bacterium]